MRGSELSCSGVEDVVVFIGRPFGDKSTHRQVGWFPGANIRLSLAVVDLDGIAAGKQADWSIYVAAGKLGPGRIEDVIVLVGRSIHANRAGFQTKRRTCRHIGRCDGIVQTNLVTAGK